MSPKREFPAAKFPVRKCIITRCALSKYEPTPDQECESASVDMGRWERTICRIELGGNRKAEKYTRNFVENFLGKSDSSK